MPDVTQRPACKRAGPCGSTVQDPVRVSPMRRLSDVSRERPWTGRARAADRIECELP